MSRIAWAYVAGGAGEGRTMRNNREAFEHWRIVPRMLHGVTERDLRISIVGTQMSSPLLLAPIGAVVGRSTRQRSDHCPRRCGGRYAVRDLQPGM
jgi:isopentenyl diphosphate isomerase/L-lactate dehydrogenase-like FMN-dependent dehydrogenase